MLFAAMAAASLFALAGCGSMHGTGDGGVHNAAVLPSKPSAPRQLDGILRSRESRAIRLTVGGVLQQRLLEEGSAAIAGQAIAILDLAPFRDEMERTTRAFAAAEQRVPGVPPTEAEPLFSRAGTSAEIQWASAEAELVNARRALAAATIVAPLPGLVRWVGMIDGIPLAVGTEVARIEYGVRPHVMTRVPASEVGVRRTGQRARVRWPRVLPMPGLRRSNVSAT